MTRVKKAILSVIGLLAAAIILEILGYWGLYFMGQKYCYSPVVNTSAFVSHESPYLRLRKVLMGYEGYYPKYYSSYNLNYALTPYYNFDSIEQHNKDGYRGRLINCQKGNKLRILFLGGTPVYGLVQKPDEALPAQTEAILKEYMKQDTSKWKGVEVINGGLPDGTSAEELLYYIHKYRYYKPDLVIIHSGGTDAHIDHQLSSFTPDYSGCRGHRVWQMERIIPACFFKSYFISFLAIACYYAPRNVDIDRASTLVEAENNAKWFPDELKQKITVGDYSYNPFYKNLSTLVRSVLRDNAKIVLIPIATNPSWKYYKPFYAENVKQNNGIIRAIAGQYNIPVVDYKYESIPADCWIDYQHLNAKGERIKSELVSRYVEMALK